MLGWIHLAFKSMVEKLYGIEKWANLLKIANIAHEIEYIESDNYEDDQTFRLLRSLALDLGISSDKIYEMFGERIITYALENGYKNALTCLANNFEDFLKNLNQLLFFLNRFKFDSKMKLPHFNYEALSDGSIHLHYYSHRNGLELFTKGILQQCAKVLFNQELEIFVQEVDYENLEQHYEHVIFMIKPKNEHSFGLLAKNKSELCHYDFKPISLSLKSFARMCPTHICFNKNMMIEHVGDFLRHELDLTSLNSLQLFDLFEMTSPAFETKTFDKISRNQNAVYVLSLKKPLKRNGDKPYQHLELKGQMIQVNNGESLLFLNSPYITNAWNLLKTHIYLSDFTYGDTVRELIILNQSLIYHHNASERLNTLIKQNKDLTIKLTTKKAQTLNLLHEFLPPMIVEQRLHQTDKIAEAFPEVTCMISSVAFFEVILNNCNAKEIFTLVTKLFHVYDRLIDLHKCHKVASIKDAYFVVAGVKEKSEHASRILNLAIGFLHESKQIIIPQINMPVVLRIAIHTGPVVAGLVGKTTVRYTLVGEGFDFANQIIQLEEMPGQIILTNATRNCVKKSEKDSFVFINNGYKQVQKNQATCTFRLDKNKKKSVWDIVEREPDPLKSIDGYKELFENDLNKWLDFERDLQRQLAVIALMKNKPIPSNTVAYKRLRWAQLSRYKSSFKSGDSNDSKGSRDSGITSTSVSSSSVHTKSSLCEIM